jgi:hypothetical protein
MYDLRVDLLWVGLWVYDLWVLPKALRKSGASRNCGDGTNDRLIRDI